MQMFKEALPAFGGGGVPAILGLVHEFERGGMALVERDGGDKLDPVSLRALGLNGGS
jgi:hypothetical protein